MSRAISKVYGYETGYPGARAYLDRHFHEWAMIVGDRIRRLRRDREWTLGDLASRVLRPDGGHYDPSYFSKLERGIALAPLVAYLRIADVLGVAPGRLLGPDDAFNEIDAGEAALLAVIRETGVTPAQAILRIVGSSSG